MNTPFIRTTGVLASTLLLTTFGASAALAEASTAASSPAPTATASSTATHLAAVKTKGDADISVRLASLTTLVTKVSGLEKLSSAEKSSLAAEIQAQITGLTALKATLDGETSVDTARTDFNDIFSQHYVYAFYLPRIDRLAAADAASSAATSLLALAPKLQAYLTTAQQQGKDITSLQAALTEMTAKATDAQAQAQSAITALTPLTASQFQTNKTIVSNEVSGIKAARSDLQTARTDAHTVVDGLRKLLGTSTVT
jgi:hypothetical protein